MNIQEQMDEIMGDYHKLPTWFKRRVSEETLEKKFKDSLHTQIKVFISENGMYMSGAKIECDVFIGRVIHELFLDIYQILPYDEPLNDWYDEVFLGLKDYFSDRIKEKYKELKKFM
jgi:hypothetical protein